MNANIVWTDGIVNQQFKQHHALYRGIATMFGLSECEFWILYAIAEDNSKLSQHQLSNQLCIPKATLNSAVKQLSIKGLISLQKARGSNREKIVALTGTGISFVRQSIKPLRDAENNAFLQLTSKEGCALLALQEKYIAILQNNFEKTFTMNFRLNRTGKLQNSSVPQV